MEIGDEKLQFIGILKAKCVKHKTLRIFLLPMWRTARLAWRSVKLTKYKITEFELNSIYYPYAKARYQLQFWKFLRRKSQQQHFWQKTPFCTKASAVAEFHKYNYIVLPNLIDLDRVQHLRAQFAELVDQPENQPVFLTKTELNTYDYAAPAEYLDQIRNIYNPSRKLPLLLDLAYDSFRPMIESILKSDFAIENMWIYETKNQNGKETFNLNSKPHYDGDPREFVKLIIYLSDVDIKNGPFVVVDPKTKTETKILGSAGTAILFRSKLVFHKAENTIDRPRYAASFLLSPSAHRTRRVYCDWAVNVMRRRSLWSTACGFRAPQNKML